MSPIAAVVSASTARSTRRSTAPSLVVAAEWPAAGCAWGRHGARGSIRPSVFSERAGGRDAGLPTGSAGPAGGTLGTALMPPCGGDAQSQSLVLRLGEALLILRSREGFTDQQHVRTPDDRVDVPLGRRCHGLLSFCRELGLSPEPLSARRSTRRFLFAAAAAHAATSVLRGRPRGRLRATTTPEMNSSPPQTPQGSRRA